jgi:hypothetical protein
MSLSRIGSRLCDYPHGRIFDWVSVAFGLCSANLLVALAGDDLPPLAPVMAARKRFRGEQASIEWFKIPLTDVCVNDSGYCISREWQSLSKAIAWLLSFKDCVVPWRRFPYSVAPPAQPTVGIL